MNEIFSKRIKSGRKLRAFSQQKLADLVGVSKQMISKYEKGLSIPSSSLLIKLAKSLNLDLDYFFSPSLVELGPVNFRKKSRLSIKRLDSIKEEIKLKLSNYLEVENILQIDNEFDIPVQKRKLNSLKEVSDLVLKIRKEWKIGLDPVHNITQLLEDQKIKVIEIEEEENLFDGLATLVDEKYAVIVVNESFPIERKRFTLLHELGHLILDLPECSVEEEENFCNKFASEFLFPRVSVLREFGHQRENIALPELIEVQKKYGISIQAIVFRLVDCGILSKHRQTLFYKKINFDRNLKEHINQERFETNEFSHRFEQLVYRAYSQELISASKVASLLGLKECSLRNERMSKCRRWGVWLFTNCFVL